MFSIMTLFPASRFFVPIEAVSSRIIASQVNLVFAWCAISIALFSNDPRLVAETPAATFDSQQLVWERFRGRDGLGTLLDCKVNLPWSSDQVSNVSLPGTGNGSAILVGDQAFLMSADPDSAMRHMIGIDLTEAKLIWTKSYPSKPHSLHKFSSYASSTPCTDGKFVYFTWADPSDVIVKAFQLDGTEVWTRSLGRYVSQHGFGTSPMVVDGKVILLNSQDAQELPAGVEPGTDSMLALDCKSGSTIWEQKLPTTRVCYGVPNVRRVGNATELVCSTTGQGMFALDLQDGSLRWSHDCFKMRVCSSSLLLGDLLIGTHGSGGGRDNLLVAWDIDKKEERFRINRFAPYVPTPVAKDDLLFLWSDNGIVTCIDLKTGESIWNKRIGGDYSSSPVILGNKLINTSHAGDVHFLAASREYQELATIKTDKVIRSTIAADQKRVLLRTESELWIIR
jgi:outer membrane protein assembly factor BamB